MPSPDDLPGAPDPTLRSAPTTALDARSNGHGTLEPPSEFRRRPPGPSTKPALIVLGLTLMLFLLGVGLEVLSGSQSRPTTSPKSVVTARGAVLHAVPARPLVGAIISSGQPPDDLLDAMAVPRGSAPVPSSALTQGVETYDRSLRFEVPATQQDVITFFRAQLPSEHWRRLSQGAAAKVPGGYLILEQHPASDGLEWDLGVTVSPTFFGALSTGSSAPASGTTSFTLRLYAVSDQD
ncbi:MAG TPA: hypothetical protein VK283_03030 [Acidimicrobiales bacterium]|nr:hypothetical protein [Acidimicrobiales bacterium]